MNVGEHRILPTTASVGASVLDRTALCSSVHRYRCREVDAAMIIKASRAGRHAKLVAHLRRLDTNEHMEVVQIRGTVATISQVPFLSLQPWLPGRAASARSTTRLSHRIEEHLTRDQWLFAVDELEARLD